MKALLTRLCCFHLLFLSISGCASSRLEIEVSVYKGSLVNSKESLLVSAYGMAQSIRDTAEHAMKSWTLSSRTKELFSQIVIDFEGNSSDGGTTDGVLPARTGAEDLSVTSYFNNYMRDPDDTEKQRICALAIMRFGERAEALSSHLGFREAVSPIGAPEIVRATIAIAETGKILQDLVDSAIRLHGLAANECGANISRTPIDEISRYMKSQSASSTVVAFREARPAYRDFVNKIYEGRYWEPINHISVEGGGDAQYLLMKDEIGNWHLKRAEFDPSKVINAINASIVSAINIASAAAGLPIKLPYSQVPTSDRLFLTSINDLLYGQGGSPDDGKAEELSKLRRLSTRLAEIKNQAAGMDLTIPENVKTLKQMIETALEQASL